MAEATGPSPVTARSERHRAVSLELLDGELDAAGRVQQAKPHPGDTGDGA